MPKRPSKKPVPDVRYPLRELIRDIWPFLSPYRGRLLFATVMSILGNVVNLVPWLALGKLVTALGAWKVGGSVDEIYWWTGALLLSMAGRPIAMYFSRTRGNFVAERVVMDVRVKGMAQLLSLDIAWHERENAGNKMKRIDSGAENILRLVRIWLNSIIDIAISLAGTLAILAYTDRFVSIATLLFLAVYTPFSSYMRHRTSLAARAVNAEVEKLSGTMFEAINNVRTAKVLDMTRELVRIIRGHADVAYDKVRVRVGLSQFSNSALGVLSVVFRAGAMLYIIDGIFQGRFEVGFLVMFGGYYNRLTDGAVELSDTTQDVDVARFSISRMMEVFRAPIVDPGTLPYPSEWKVISLRNVGYSYGGRTVLEGVTFDIRRGERVGVVGLSGAGKSTLFKLLLKELGDYTGEILVDGVSLRDIKKGEYYRHAAVVLQETEVFNFSLRQNVTIAAQDGQRDKPRLARALDIAYVTDFLSRMPRGVETVIGEKGVKLSGGERQRVGIARAIFKRPDILFLDEATSHLDLESEERIRDSLHKFFREVTAVVIAHRLTTIKEMDRIVLLEQGRLLEQGTFDELYRARGRFYELWEKQKLG